MLAAPLGGGAVSQSSTRSKPHSLIRAFAKQNSSAMRDALHTRLAPKDSVVEQPKQLLGTPLLDASATSPSLRSGSRRLTAADFMCEGVMQELNACNTQACPVANQPVDCEFSEWGEWDACPCGSVRQRRREIAQSAMYLGKQCDGGTTQLGPCDAKCEQDERIACDVSEWSAWSDCTRSCDGGQQYRSREIARNSRNGGDGCEQEMHQTQSCNAFICPGEEPIDCEWGEWERWSDCSVPCGGGERRRQRSVQTAPRNGGKLCDAQVTMEIDTCNLHECAGGKRDCVWGRWEEWSDCSASCDGGQRYRTRDIALRARAGGAGCDGDFQHFETCNEQVCEAPPALTAPWKSGVLGASAAMHATATRCAHDRWPPTPLTEGSSVERLTSRRLGRAICTATLAAI